MSSITAVPAELTPNVTLWIHYSDDNADNKMVPVDYCIECDTGDTSVEITDILRFFSDEALELLSTVVAKTAFDRGLFNKEN